MLEKAASEEIGDGKSAEAEHSFRPSLRSRIVPAMMKRIRLRWLRVRHPSARFQSHADIRRRFCLRMSEPAHVEIGRECILDNDMTIECTGTLIIGDRSIFGHHCTLASRASITIGEDCLIAEMVSIRDHNHRFDTVEVAYREQGMKCSPVRIGRNVWIGAKVTILMGVTIGDNAVIGANAVVTKDIPPNAIAVGVPAKVIRMMDRH